MNKLTPYQQKYANLVAQGVEPDLAARAAYGGKYVTQDMAARMSNGMMQRPKVREEISTLMSKYGLTRGFLVKKLFKLLNQPYLDPETLRKSLKDAFELHGDLNKKQEGESANESFWEMFTRYRKARDLPIPADVEHEIKNIQDAEVVEEMDDEPLEVRNNKGELMAVPAKRVKRKEAPVAKKRRRS